MGKLEASSEDSGRNYEEEGEAPCRIKCFSRLVGVGLKKDGLSLASAKMMPFPWPGKNDIS